MPADIEVKNNTDDERFETQVDGVLAVCEYQLEGDKIIFMHTEVPEEIAGRGVANALVQHALDHAKSEKLTVVPLCQFVAAYIRRHPEYEGLVGDEAAG